MGFYYRNTAWQAPTKSERNERRTKARALLDKAIELEPENYLNHYLMGHLHSDSGDFDLARAQYDKTKKLNPSFSNAFVGGAASLIYLGELDAAIADIRHGMTIDPLHPEWFHRYLAWASWTAGDCTAAEAALDQMTRPSTVALKTEAVVQICLGGSEAAKIAVQAALEREPNLTLSREQESFEGVWTDPGKLDEWLGALRQAGLPE
jgi:tetratricopeptide (TPR) repeat protein